MVTFEWLLTYMVVGKSSTCFLLGGFSYNWVFSVHAIFYGGRKESGGRKGRIRLSEVSGMKSGFVWKQTNWIVCIITCIIINIISNILLINCKQQQKHLLIATSSSLSASAATAAAVIDQVESVGSKSRTYSLHTHCLLTAHCNQGDGDYY